MTDDILTAPEAGGRVIRGSVWRLGASVAGIALGLVTAALLLHHLGVSESGRYVTVLSLVAIMSAVADLGVGITASRELALRSTSERRALVANVVGVRIVILPPTLALVVLFAFVAGYPGRMVLGTALAGTGAALISVAHAFLSRLTVELRNAGLALLDFAKQVVTVVCVAALVAVGARLTPFFAVLIVTGIVVLALVPLVGGPGTFMRPRFDRAEQRELLRTALPMAIALALGQVYFRLVIVLMSLISSTRQTGYFGGSLRAMESLVDLPALLVAVALPVLATAGRDDLVRLRSAVIGLSQGAVIAGTLLVLVTVRAAEPVMVIIGGHAFRPAGAVLRIQVVALLFITLYQIWGGSLLALDRQRDLIFTNGLALIGVAAFAAVLVPNFGAQGGATASVLGDALLCGLIYWRLQRVAGRVMVKLAFLARVAVAAALAVVPLLVAALPGLVAAALSGIVFIVVGELVGMVPAEVHAALDPRRLLRRGA